MQCADLDRGESAPQEGNQIGSFDLFHPRFSLADGLKEIRKNLVIEIGQIQFWQGAFQELGSREPLRGIWTGQEDACGFQPKGRGQVRGRDFGLGARLDVLAKKEVVIPKLVCAHDALPRFVVPSRTGEPNVLGEQFLEPFEPHRAGQVDLGLEHARARTSRASIARNSSAS